MIDWISFEIRAISVPGGELESDRARVERVVRARAATFRHRTASAVFRVATKPPSPGGTAVGVGGVEFATRRYRLAGSLASVGDGGKSYSGVPGQLDRWFTPIGAVADAPAAGTPFWLLDILAGAVAATERGAGCTGGACAYECEVDLVLADERLPAGVRAPGDFSIRALRRLPASVAIDDRGALARVACDLDHMQLALELSDYDRAEPIVLPKPGEIIGSD